MAKKPKEMGGDGPNPSAVKDKDLMQRLNFLYQTSVYLAQVSGGQPPESSSSAPEPKNRKRERNGSDRFLSDEGRQSLMDLSRQYTRSMKAIGNKAVLRMDPSVKRTICRGCQTVLVSGVTAKVRIKASRVHTHITRYICVQCKTARNYPSPPTVQPLQVTPSGEVLQATTTTPESTATTVENGTNVSMPSEDLPQPLRSRRKAKQFQLPPLFERDVGHVVFVGNEKTPRQPAVKWEVVAKKA